MKPKERREIIDEIAGIKDYNEKKDKALTELAMAEIKLNESKIVLDQKKEYIDKLKTEKEAAEKFVELETQQDFLLASIAHSKVEGIKSVLNNVITNLKIKEAEYGGSNSKVGNFDTDLDSFEQTLEKVEKEVFERSMDNECRKEVEDLNERIIKRAAKIEGHHKDIERLDDMISRLDAINRSKTEDVSNRSVKAILESGIDGVSGSIGTLMSIEGLYQTAIDIALGGHVNDVIVDSENTAIQCISYLKENNMGRVRFLPMPRLRHHTPSAKSEIAQNMPGIMDYALNLIDYDPKYDIAFRDVLKDTLVAESSDAARKVKGLRLVTLEGDLFESGGAIVGGAKRHQGKTPKHGADMTAILDYEKEKSNAEVEIRMLKEEIGELNLALDNKKKDMDTSSDDIQNLEKKRQDLKEKISKIKENRKTIYEQNIMLQQEIEDL
ncbi:MAG: hypothetical protein KAI18_04300, partial [Candidatus Aenigmarchaeota archaeon]|nr:hypothetical protein [Candidatus Aenigmarchaeota archaeon]